MFTQQELQAAGGRGVEVGNGADFAFAHHADRRHHRRKERQRQHKDARCDGEDAFEVGVVTKARHELGGVRRQTDAVRVCLVAGVVAEDAGDVAGEVAGVEGFGAVEVEADFRARAAQEVAAKGRRDVDDHFRGAAFEGGVDVGISGERRQLVELAGSGEVFDDGAAFRTLVAVAHGEGEVADVKGNAPGDGGHEDDRAEEGEEGADVVAQQFFAFADGEGADGGEPAAEGLEGSCAALFAAPTSALPHRGRGQFGGGRGGGWWFVSRCSG